FSNRAAGGPIFQPKGPPPLDKAATPTHMIAPERAAMNKRQTDEPLTLIDKLWSAHEIVRREDGAALLWADRHYVHEGSFHSFSEMQARGGTVAEPGLTFAVADHYVPTRNRGRAVADPEIAALIDDLEANAAAHH